MRDRALIGVRVFTLARVSAACGLNVADIFHQQRRLWVRLHEKGGKFHEMPCHHTLEGYLAEYVERARLGDAGRVPLFQAIKSRPYGRGEAILNGERLHRTNAWAMVRWRAKAAGITTEVCNHTFRGTGITAYLENGGTLEKARQMAAHASTRTTQLYDRREDRVTLDEDQYSRVGRRQRFGRHGRSTLSDGLYPWMTWTIWNSPHSLLQFRGGKCRIVGTRPQNSAGCTMVKVGTDEKVYPAAKIALVVDALRENGVAPDEALQGAHVSAAELNSPATRISLNQVLAVYRNAVRLAPHPHFAYLTGLRSHVSTYGMYGFALRAWP